MSPRRRRILTADEQALWAHVTRHIAPIPEPSRGRAKSSAASLSPLGPPLVSEPPDPPGPAPAQPAPAKPTPGKFRKPAWKAAGQGTPAGPPHQDPAPHNPPPAPPLAPLERRLRQRLARGSQAIDAVIDLHGLRQDEAHHALRNFLHGAQRQGHAVVLVVTGKGGAAAGDGTSLFEERGVLRRSVPHWLRLPDMRSVVVGFEEAVRHHGGGGALYVRVRRARVGPP